MKSSRLSALDGLRGYAALMVVFFHSILGIDLSQMDVLKQPIYQLNNFYDFFSKISLILFNGHAAVDLFFVLSGAILVRCLQQSRETTGTAQLFAKFTIQRIFRVCPALIVCLVGIYCLSNILYQIYPAIFHVHFSMQQFWQNFLLYKITLHGASWTLQAEMLAIPFVFLAFYLFNLQRNHNFWMFFILILYAGIFCFYQSVAFVGFFLGFLVILPKIGRFFSRIHPGAVFFFLVLTLVTKHFFPYEGTLLIKCIRRALQSIAVFGLIAFVYHHERGIFIKFLNHPISQYLGRISYSLYLFNVLGLHALIAVTRYYFPEWCTQNPLVMGLLLGLGLTLITLPIAHFSYQYVEKPGIKLGRWLATWSFWPGMASQDDQVERARIASKKTKNAPISYDSSPASLD